MAEQKQSAVDDLIASAFAPRAARLSPDVVESLRKFVAHNDAGKGQRITAAQAMDAILKDHGIKMGESKFHRVVKEVLGRRWGG